MGVQESRLRSSTPIRTHGYRILQAAADEAANYGVQLWVAEGGPVKFAGLQVVGQGPRHLIVASAVPACHFVVAHAPLAANGNLMELAALRGFWDKVSDALVAGAAVKIVLLADANAVVGSVPSDAIGTVRADVESQAGAVFHRWLQRWRVCLPSTFVEGRGDGATWTPPGGGPRRRIDFVGVPLDWLHLVVEAEVDQSIDLSIKRPDHDVAGVQLRGLHVKGRYLRRTRDSFDPRGLGDPVAVERFAACIAAVPLPSWDVDVDEHADRLAAGVRWALCMACPRCPPRPRQDWVSQQAAGVSAVRAGLLRAVRCARAGGGGGELGLRSLRGLVDAVTATAPTVAGLDGASVLVRAPELLGRLRALAADGDLCAWAKCLVEGHGDPGPRAAPAEVPGPNVAAGFLEGQAGHGGPVAVGACLGALAAQALALHTGLGSALKRVLRRDRREALRSRAAGVGRDFAEGRLREAWGGLRALRAACRGSRKARRRTAPIVALDDGNLAPSAEAAAERWLHYFGDMELATYHGVQELVEDLRAEQERPLEARAPRLLDGGLSARSLLPLREVEGLFRSATPGRKSGLDGLPPDAFACAPAAMARLYLGLYTKVALRVTEPIVFKGGSQVPVWKGQGAQHLCPSFRQILLGSVPGKLFHRGLRPRLLTALRSYGHGTVFSLGGTGVDMAAHYPRAVADWAAARGLSVAVLFVGVSSAYYEAAREFIVEPTGGSAAERLVGLGACDEERASLRALLEAVPALREAGVAPHDEALVAEALSGTWFSVEGAAEVARAWRGTRPGAPIADLCFAFLAARCLRQVRDELRAEGLLAEVPGGHVPRGARPSLVVGRVPEAELPGALEVTDGLYADDDLFVVPGPAGEVVARTAAAALIVARGFRRFRLRLNFGKGKTEAVVRFAGRGAREASGALAAAGSKVELPDFGAGPVELRFPASYKHMGAVFDRKGAELPEVAARRQAVGAERRSLQGFLRDAGSTLSSRLHVSGSVVLGILLFSAGVWSRCGPGALKQLEAEYELSLRSATSQWWSEERKEGATDLRVRLGAPPVAVLVLAARLRYFARFCRSAPAELVAVIRDTPGWRNRWLADVVAALAWLRRFCPLVDELPPPSVDLGPWEDLARAHPQAWKAWVRRAIASAVAQEGLVRTGERTEDAVVELAFGQVAAGAPWPQIGHELGAPFSPPGGGAQHECPECGKAFADPLRLRRHRSGKHLVTNPARRWADGSVCRWCNKDFGVRPRLVRHLAYAARGCLEGLRSTVEPLSVEEADALDAADRPAMAGHVRRGRDRLWAEAPVRRLPGAALREAALAGVEAAAAPPPAPGGQAPDLGAAAPAPEGFGDEAPEAPEAEPALAPAGTAARICGLQPGSLSFGPGRAPSRRWTVVAHLFSGPRRRQDVQALVEQVGRERGVAVVALSVDVLFGEAGDLADPERLGQWRAWCREGVVAAFVAGPPCNTWSRARALGADAGGARAPGRPRPVRSAESPWAREGLTPGEVSHVRLANELLQATLWWFAEMALAGGAAVIEHPECWEVRAAIWRLPVVLALLRARECALVSFDQCMFGSPARAPTSLLLLRAPGIVTALAAAPNKGRCNHGPRAHEVLTGLDERGVWRTARKRAYRPPLCRLLAEGLLDGGGGAAPGGTRDEAVEALPGDLRPFLQELPPGAGVETDDAYADLARAGGGRTQHREAVLARRRARELERARLQDAFVAGFLEGGPDVARETL